MSIKQIIQESINKNPVGLKEALEEELRSRVAEALEEMMSEEVGEDLDLSDYTTEELEDFMMSEDFEQLDEISKKTLAAYVKKASDDKANNAYQLGAKDPLKTTGSWSKAFKRKTGIEKAVNRLAK
jgi:hypothetical protein